MPATPAKQPFYNIAGHRLAAPPLAPGLYLVATPIGNLADITIRALQTLSAAETIYCEDTRISARLLERYGIKGILKPYHDHNAARQRPAIIAQLEAGKAIAVISDAGTPLVSDPGYKLVAECIARDLPVDVIPGANAPLTALALSGLPSSQFRFCGFLPPRQAARSAFLRDLAQSTATLIFFDSARRLPASLADIAAAMPQRAIAVCRELTKLHQEIVRGTVDEVAADISARTSLKGEITLIVAPAGPTTHDLHDTDVAGALAEALTTQPAAKAAGQIARQFGLKKSDVYDLALQIKQRGQGR